MPKKPSGAQFKKQRKAREEQARRDEAERRNGEPADVLPQYLKPLASIKAPEGADYMVPNGLDYAHRVCVELLRLVAQDPKLDLERRIRLASDLIGKLGLTANKTHFVQRMEALNEDEDDGLEDLPYEGGQLVPNPLASTDALYEESPYDDEDGPP